MGKTPRQGNPEYIRAAQAKLDAGKPRAALEKLYMYSEDSGEGFLPYEYWRLRAITALLTGASEEVDGFLKEIGGISLGFFERYKAAFEAFAARPLPRFRRWRIRHEGVIRFNIGKLIEFAKEVGEDPHAVGQEAASIIPRQR